MGRQPDTRFIREDAEIIRHKVRKLIGRYGFTVSDEPDLQQELAMHVSMRMAKYDPARGARSTYVDRIVRNKIINILAHHTAAKRGGHRRPLPLDEAYEDLLPDSRGDARLADLRLDVRNALKGLPPQLRKVAICLAKHSPSEAERILGLTRGQIRERLAAIRLHLEAAGISLPKQQPKRRRSR